MHISAEAFARTTDGLRHDRKLSVGYAAQYLGVSESYLNKLRSRGGGPEFFKVGARVVYAVADLDLWLNRRRRRSTADVGPE